MKRPIYRLNGARSWVRKCPRILVRFLALVAIPLQLLITLGIVLWDERQEFKEQTGTMLRCAFGKWEITQ